MKCLNCNNNIKIKKNILNFFKIEYSCICTKCLEESKYNPNLLDFPIDNKKFYVFSLLENNNFNYDCFKEEYEKTFAYFSKFKKCKIFTFEKFYLNDDNYDYVEVLSKNFECNIIILCYYVNF